MEMEGEVTGQPFAGSGHGLDGTGFEMPEGFEFLDSHIRNAVAHPRLSEEERFAKKVAAKRQSEAERRARIFDAKRRTIGVDKEMLDKQVIENRLKREAQQAQGRSDDSMMRNCDKMLKLLEIEKQTKQRTMEKHCKDYSLQNLNFAARREYDLNDPLYVRKGVPVRLGDDDPRCGPSSMQQFNGEDLGKEERIRQQRACMVNFIEQQKFEKSMLGAHTKGDMDAFAAEVAEITRLRDEMEEHEGNLRKELQRGQQDENLAKAAENFEKKMNDKDLENDRNQQELAFHATDKFLNETGQVFYSDGRAEPRVSYKGSTREERVQVMLTQKEQCGENVEKRAADRYGDFGYAAQAEATRKHLVATERAKQQERRRAAMAIAEENRQMQVQQAQNSKDLNQLYTNKFSPEFFEQFGTGVR